MNSLLRALARDDIGAPFISCINIFFELHDFFCTITRVPKEIYFTLEKVFGFQYLKANFIDINMNIQSMGSLVLWPRSLIYIRSSRFYSSKVSSDEKLLNSILNEQPENDTTETYNQQPPSTYRKNSLLSVPQKNNAFADSGDKTSKPLPIGPKYWKNKFRKSYRKVEKGLMSPLDEYVSNNIEVIESYNKKYKQSVEERIKVDFKKELHWNDVIPNHSLRKAILRYLASQNNASTNDNRFTSFQKRFFALMSCFASTVAKGPSGSGKSFALLIHALSIRRSHTRGKGINSLIVVKSNSLVRQYEQLTNDILAKMDSKQKVNVKLVSQFLYRGTPLEEMKQDDDLTDYQTPHILVTTPQRLLDVLSSRGMDFVKINSLSYIGVDDFTSMLDENQLLETQKKSPVVNLLDYVLKLQDYRRQHNDPHPQVVLMVEESATESLILQLKEYTKWIDWRKFALIGKFGEEEDIPYYKYIANKSAVSTVLVYPRFSQDGVKGNSTSRRFKVNLYDMKPFDYGSTSSTWLNKLYRESFGNSLVYKKHRNSKWSSIPNVVKKGELEILCSGLGKLLKKKNIIQWIGKNRALVVHPDEVNSKQVVDILSSKTRRKVKVFDIYKDAKIFRTRFSDEDEDDSQLFAINASSLTGLNFPGLSTIFVLGIDSIKSESHLSTIMGRARTSDGLVPEKEYTIFSERTNSSVDEKEDIRARTFIITAMLPDSTIDPYDRNFLERAYLVNGLVNQVDAIGVQENWTDKEKKDYKLAIEGSASAYKDDVNIEFGGLGNFVEHISNISNSANKE